MLNKTLDHNIFFKAECLQKIGAFKTRGIINSVISLKDKQNSIKRVVTNSSGNYAQAIAWIVSQLNVPASIYMPKNVSKVKVLATKHYGAKVILTNTRLEADQRVAEAAEQDGVHWIHPFNNEDVICG